jgi:hypothetical protein
MLAILAAVALVVGGVSAATVVASDHAAAQDSKHPVVQVQAVQPTDSKSAHSNF